MQKPKATKAIRMQSNTLISFLIFFSIKKTSEFKISLIYRLLSSFANSCLGFIALLICYNRRIRLDSLPILLSLSS